MPTPADEAREASERRQTERAVELVRLLEQSLAPAAPREVAQRYRVNELLGRGASGSVWSAVDRLSGRTVALKLFEAPVGNELVRLRAEIAALRLLRVPGVAHLYDEGLHDGRPYLVTDLVDGRPFPGRALVGPAAARWNQLRPTACALLETLARVHGHGVVHRDLKPGNVLVDAEGRPVLLDFGLVAGRGPLLNQQSPAGAFCGTPAYAAPEQCAGEAVDARADLYAVGVMLYEALSGRRPHVADSQRGLIEARLAAEPAPLHHLLPDLPTPVASLVDRLLRRDPASRPDSAREVLAELQGELPVTERHELPLVGRDTLLAQLSERLAAGAVLHLAGEAGSGRSRLLSELRNRLLAAGRRVLLLRPRSEPLAACEALTPWLLRDEEPTDLATAVAALRTALCRALELGTIVLVDDADRLDRPSRQVLAGAEHGPLLLVLASAPGRGDGAQAAGEGWTLPPLSVADLALLFEGSDRLLHLREDAASELHARTGGRPARVVEELRAWERAGLAQRHGLQHVLSRQALDRLASGLMVESASASPDIALEPALEELLAAARITGGRARAEQLATLLDRPHWRVEAELDSLLLAGAVQLVEGGGVRALQADGLLSGPAGSLIRRRLHAAAADLFAPGTPGRFEHLLGAERWREAAREGADQARALLAAGRAGAAEGVLGDALRAARAAEDALAERSVLAVWTHVALAELAPAAVDRALYETSRSEHRDAELARLEALLRAASSTYEGSCDRALAELETAGPFAEAELERWRQALRVRTARKTALDVEQRVVAEAGAAIARDESADARASLAEWEGRLRYREGDWGRAADLFATAAARFERPTARLSALLNAASALLEARRLDQAAALAEQARSLAAELRHGPFEARAEWLLRTVAYRLGRAGEPDLELVELAERVGPLDQAALIALNEAAVARAGGQRQLAVALAQRAARNWGGAARRAQIALASALAVSCGATCSAAEKQVLVDAALATEAPAVGVQILALLAEGGQDLPPLAVAQVAAQAAALIAELPPEHRSIRREVLSLQEAAAQLLEAGRSQG